MSGHTTPLDVAVLGTSNCIRPDSFVTRLQPQAPIRLRNLSLGACTSSLGLYVAATLNPTARDIALIDFSLNVAYGAYAWGQEQRAEIIRRNLRILATMLRAKNYLPIVLILPHDLHVKHELFGELTYEPVCRGEKINFINLRDVFFAAIAKGGVSDALMRDSAHMSEMAGELIGAFLSDVIDRVAAGPGVADYDACICPCRVVTAPQIFVTDRLTERRSSLHSGVYGALRIGDVLRLPVEAGEAVVAIMINTGAKGGNARVRGANGELIKSLTIYWHESDPEIFSAILIDLARPIAGGAEGVSIEIVGEDSVPTESTLEVRKTLPGRYGEVEIEGLLIASIEESAGSVRGPYCGSIPLDLRDLPGASGLVASLAELRPIGSVVGGVTVPGVREGSMIRRFQAWLKGRFKWPANRLAR